ncbi:STAS domain-containing protein [Catenuloplanes atrovinosus]|uniref:Anti-sigma B factor antagonist n=1 Tax=Catenuloplanes atrovinosus TaxID=137266 RepID=A0AAE4CCJ9_9ACTN|nr:STAS domain-containing protein [Catenuloplanes atrovinosus]MDR7279268.1 anti-sigma B factor antagonist [Catenuloplanes atrovinosus]
MPTTRILTRDGPACLEAVGEFDRDNHHEIAAAVRHAISRGHPHITLDLRGVTYLDASAVRTLMACRYLALAHGGGLRVLHANGVVAFVLDATGAGAALSWNG